MRRKKIMIVLSAGLMLVLLSLAADAVYAWYTTQAAAQPEAIDTGYVRIDLEREALAANETLYPGKYSVSVKYKLTNRSKIPVNAAFTPGEPVVYRVPDVYLDQNGCVDKAWRTSFLALQSEDEQMQHLQRETVINKNEVLFGIAGDGGENSWIVSPDSWFLGVDKGQNAQFMLAPGGTAECVFTLALNDDADNKYQHALFKMSDAEAYAEQIY